MELDKKYLQLVIANIQNDSQGTHHVKYRLKASIGMLYLESSKHGFRTQREAKLFVEELKHTHAEAMYKKDNPATTMTFAELYERYRVSRITDKPSTIIDWESIIQSRILPFLSICKSTISCRTQLPNGTVAFLMMTALPYARIPISEACIAACLLF